MSGEVIEVVFDNNDDLDKELKLSNALMGAITHNTILHVLQACKSRVDIFGSNPKRDILASKLKRLWVSNVTEINCVPINRSGDGGLANLDSMHSSNITFSNNNNSSSNSSNNASSASSSSSGVNSNLTEISSAADQSNRRSYRSRLTEKISNFSSNKSYNSYSNKSNSHSNDNSISILKDLPHSNNPNIYRGYLGRPAGLIVNPRTTNSESISGAGNQYKVNVDYTLRYLEGDEDFSNQLQLGYKRKNRSAKYNSLPFEPVTPNPSASSEEGKALKMEEVLKKKKALVLSQTLTSKNIIPVLGMKIYINLMAVAPHLHDYLHKNDCKDWKLARVCSYESTKSNTLSKLGVKYKSFKIMARLLHLHDIDIEVPWDVNHVRIFYCHPDPNDSDAKLNAQVMIEKGEGEGEVEKGEDVYLNLGDDCDNLLDDDDYNNDDDDDDDDDGDDSFGINAGNNSSNNSSSSSSSSSNVVSGVVDPMSIARLIDTDEEDNEEEEEEDDDGESHNTPSSHATLSTSIGMINAHQSSSNHVFPLAATISGSSNTTTSIVNSDIETTQRETQETQVEADNSVWLEPEELPIDDVDWRSTSLLDIDRYFESVDYSNLSFKFNNSFPKDTASNINYISSGMSSDNATGTTTSDVYKVNQDLPRQIYITGKVKSFKKNRKQWRLNLKWVVLRIFTKEYVFPLCRVTFAVDDILNDDDAHGSEDHEQVLAGFGLNSIGRSGILSSRVATDKL